MNLVHRVLIRRFRSIAEIELEFGELTALIGGNGSGKSNVLRALSLYFNDEIEPGEGLDLRRDIHRPWNNKKPILDIAVEFRLPPSFTIHKALRDPLKAIGIAEGGAFAISKRWSSGTSPGGRPSLEVRFGRDLGEALDVQPLGEQDVHQAERFLQLIRFRYVPNHEHPSQVLVAEQAALQEALITSLRRKRTKDAAGAVVGERFDAALNAVADSAQALVGPINDALSATGGPVELLQLATPNDWAEVVWSLAFRLKAHGQEPLDSRVHGSGSQSQVMYEMLYFLDTRFASRFGWHQATVWALEEPESFLHADLRNQLIAFFSDRAETDRFQALLTTHDLVFASSATLRHWIEVDGGDSRAEMLTAAELADRSVSEGVSSYVHPLNLTVMKPTLLLEGPSDVYFVSEAYRRAGRINPWDIRYLGDVDGAAGGGKDALKKYLKANRAAIKARPTRSPVLVVLDWEVSENEVQAASETVAVHPRSSVRKWPADKCNPELTESWAGIERFLSSELVAAVASADPAAGITKTVGDSPLWELSLPKRNSVKQALKDACASRGDTADLQLVIDLLGWLEQPLADAEQTVLLGV